jgi:dTDP-4-amino-4,6-dideoxygalactose transaminase
MSKDAATRYSEYYQHWDMLTLGWKYNMDDIHASLLVGQLESLNKSLKRREEIWELYDEAFADIPGVNIPEIRGMSARHLYTIWVDREKRDEYLIKFQDRDIGVAVNYRSIHTLTYFREILGLKPQDFPMAYRIGERTISLPFYPRLRDSEIDYVIESVRKTIN